MRHQIVVLALVSAGLALALLGVPLAVGLLQFAIAEERLMLQRVADYTAMSVETQVSHGEVPPRLPAGPGDAEIAVYDQRGVLLVGRGPRLADRPVAEALSGGAGPAADERLSVVSSISDGHEVVGAVRVAGASGSLYAVLVPAWLAMFLLAGLVLVAVWLLARRQARRLAEPLEELAVKADRLGSGDFSVRSSSSGITEVDQVGQALDSTAHRLDDLLARERAFSADASHQLRTPLAGLRLRLEFAREQPLSVTRKSIDDGLRSVDRLERTIDELLRLARERRETRCESVDLSALAREIEAEWVSRLAAEGRAFESYVPLDLPCAHASPAAVRQVLAALVDNAHLHGVGKVRLAVREIGEDALAVDVVDEGDGIPPEVLSAGEAWNAQPLALDGHGMGLSLARRLAVAEGGQIIASGPPSTMTLLLSVLRNPREEFVVGEGVEALV